LGTFLPTEKDGPTNRKIRPTSSLRLLKMVEVSLISTAADEAKSEPRTQQQLTPVLKVVGRPPPIIVTASVNLLKFQG